MGKYETPGKGSNISVYTTAIKKHCPADFFLPQKALKHRKTQKKLLCFIEKIYRF
jgi:hypothetical protein